MIFLANPQEHSSPMLSNPPYQSSPILSNPLQFYPSILRYPLVNHNPSIYVYRRSRARGQGHEREAKVTQIRHGGRMTSEHDGRRLLAPTPPFPYAIIHHFILLKPRLIVKLFPRVDFVPFTADEPCAASFRGVMGASAPTPGRNTSSRGQSPASSREDVIETPVVVANLLDGSRQTGAVIAAVVRDWTQPSASGIPRARAASDFDHGCLLKEYSGNYYYHSFSPRDSGCVELPRSRPAIVYKCDGPPRQQCMRVGESGLDSISNSGNEAVNSQISGMKESKNTIISSVINSVKENINCQITNVNMLEGG
ncbi:hypothetical protein PR048_004865 [Dryococelus australis]|uniref:Uncharacterized protein n=1 Tax=Dryococelus australis TaxID=614101 RepID=A0ABQ9I7Q7_9NEOP|nr:hypothetical protein PR048_004865 [Dryococelus australis]